MFQLKKWSWLWIGPACARIIFLNLHFRIHLGIDFLSSHAQTFQKMQFIKILPLLESFIRQNLHCSSTNLDSPQTVSVENISHLRITPKTKKIRCLLSSVSKLKKQLYEKRTSPPLLACVKSKISWKTLSLWICSMLLNSGTQCTKL